MLGLVLIYFIGKQFYTLAEDRNMNAWLYAFIGVGIYYLGSIIGASLVGIYLELFGNGIDSISDKALGFIGVPFGLFAVWGIHKILDKKWTDKKVDINKEIDLLGKSEEELEENSNNEVKF